MGFSLAFLPFFDAVHDVTPIKGPFLALGSQEVSDQPNAIDEYAGKNGYGEFKSTHALASLLKERYGVDEYVDIDANDSAAVKADLTAPMDKALYGRWRCAYNGGTLEHIFDVAAAFKNVHLLLAEGGVVIHALPVSWFGHGFYNFTPRLFQYLAEANGYTCIAEGWHGIEAREKPRTIADRIGKFFGGTPANQGRAGMVLTAVEGKVRPEKDAIDRLLATAFVPCNSLYFVAHRKNSSSEFRMPLDIVD